MTRRAIRLDGLDVELELSKVVSLDVDREMIILEKMKDNTWRLTFTKSVIPDIQQLKSLTIIRED